MIAAAGAALLFVGVATVLAWQVWLPQWIESRLGALIGHRVVVGGLTPGFWRIDLREVLVFGSAPFDREILARAPRVSVAFGRRPGYRLWTPSAIVIDGGDLRLLGSGTALNLAVRVTGPHGTGVRSARPTIEWRGVSVTGLYQLPGAPRLAARAADADLAIAADGGITARAHAAVLDIGGTMTMRWGQLHADSGPGSSAIDVRASDGSIEIPAGGTLVDRLTLTARGSREGGEVTLGHAAGEPGGGPRSLHATAQVLASTAHVTIDTLGLRLAALQPLLRRLGIDLSGADADVRAEASFAFERPEIPFDVAVTARGLDLHHPALDLAPWRGVAGSAHALGSYDRSSGRIAVSSGSGEAFGLPITWRGWIEPGAEPRGSLSVGTSEPLSCGALALALPARVAEPLRGMTLRGWLGLHSTISFDAANWDDLGLDLTLRPLCQTTREPDALANLLPTLSNAAGPAPKGGAAALPLGRYHPDFVPLPAMPRHLVAAFLTAEDSHFYQHRGFDLEMIRRALAHDLEVGTAARGASTVTQQVAKNLFLSPHRTFTRKLGETVLAWRLHQLLRKDRTLELYLNLIELGPGIRGLKAAARAYFGKDLPALTALESAHLAALTPNPLGLSRRFRDGQVDDGWLHRLYDLLAMMKRSGRISGADLAAARNERLTLRKI